MKTAERLPEGVGLVVRHGVNYQDQQKLKRVCDEQLFGVSCDCSQVKRDTPRCRVVFDNLWSVSTRLRVDIIPPEKLTVFRSEQIKLSTACRLHCVVMYVSALMSICATMSNSILAFSHKDVAQNALT